MLPFWIIDWTGDMTNSFVDNIGYVISDLSAPLTIIIGVGVGLIVISAIINAIRG